VLNIQSIRDKIETVKAHEGFRRYFFNTSWMFAEKILRLISGLFIGAYVARYLGPSQYGLLNYVISLVSLFTALSSLGLDQIVIRELVKNEQKRDVLLGTAAVLKLLGAIAVLIGLTILIRTTETDIKTQTLIYIIGLGVVFEVFGVIDFFFQSKVLSKFAVMSQIISLASISVLRICFVLMEAPLEWFAWVNTLDFVIMGAGFIFFYHHHGHTIFKWRFDRVVALQLLKDSWPLIFSVLAVTIYMKIDQIMVKWMISDEANGLYAVAVRLSEMWNFIPIAICASLFPAILNAREKSEALYLQRMQWLFDLMVAISVTIAIPMTFLSTWVVTLLFGDAYSDAGTVLAVYIWASVFTFLGVANGKWVIGENLQVFRMVSLVVSCILNILLNLVLIKTMGLVGAAIATLVAYAFAGYISFFFLEKTRGMFVSMTRAFNPIRILKEFNNFLKQ
jgi:O-antigen/teichoic acid export membrane protein